MENSKPTLLPLYLLCGEDALKRETALKRLRDRVASLGDLSFNSDTFSGETAQGADILAACNTIPFASPVRLVVVSAVDKLPKQAIDMLVDYAKEPCESTILALLADKLPKNSRLYKAVVASNPKALVDCAPKTKRDLPRLIKDMGRAEGVQFDDAAAYALLDLVGDDTIALNAHIKKLALSVAGGSVSEHEVRSLVARTTEAKPWEFVDAFSRREPIVCLQLLQKMESISPYALLSMCCTRIRELLCAKSLVARGQAGLIAQELKMPDWRVKNHTSWARNYTDAELRDALTRALETERAMKSGSDPKRAFENWALSVTSKTTDR